MWVMTGFAMSRAHVVLDSAQSGLIDGSIDIHTVAHHGRIDRCRASRLSRSSSTSSSDHHATGGQL